MEPDEKDYFDWRHLLHDQLVSLERALAFNRAMSERFFEQTSSTSPTPPPMLLEGGMLTASGQPCQGSHGTSANTLASMLSPPLPLAPPTWLTSPLLASATPDAPDAGGKEVTFSFENGGQDPAAKVHADGMHIFHEPPISAPNVASVMPMPVSVPREKVKKPSSKKDLSKFLSEPPASSNEGKSTSPLVSRSAKRSKTLPQASAASPSVWSLGEPLLYHKAVAALAEEGEQDTAKHEEKKKRFMMSIAEMKCRVRDCLHDEPYRETDFYSTAGPFQELARNEHFHSICIAVVVVNVVWIGIDIDMYKADVLCKAPLIFQIVDNLFCLFFVFEMLVRLLAFRDRASAFREAPFLFDFCLSALVVWECWIQVLMYKLWGSTVGPAHNYSALRAVRLLRLTRAARVAKLLDYLPELRILVKGFLLAIRSTFTIVLFLALVIYVFSLVFTQVLGDCMVGSSSFESVPATMNFFLLQVLCGFDSQFLNDLLAIHWTYYLLFLLYLFISQMALMNMLTGVICEVVSAVSEVEEQESFMLQAVERLGGVLHALDIDGNNKIDKEELESLLGNKKLLLILKDEGIDVVGLVDLVPFLFRDHDELRINEVLEFLIQYRGSKTATVRDLVEVRQFISMEIRRWAFEQHGMMLPVETSRTLTQDPLDAS
eukprot:TRINITY_DN24361_c0_g1_i2.p1 TRINITY_DN24361_c0_g1~~TRINITY_DN24361_c0_g1_i2.p1  ORF type:complete len:672 (+),score=121.78 TRINITY_DN24361_c0_g1_i2:40-2016(+)